MGEGWTQAASERYVPRAEQGGQTRLQKPTPADMAKTPVAAKSKLRRQNESDGQHNIERTSVKR